LNCRQPGLTLVDVGATIGLLVALALAVPASGAPMKPINLNLPPPTPPAQSPSQPNLPWAPTPPPSWRPAWLPPWLIPDKISVPTRKGACGWGFRNGCNAGGRP
jgi:hypothetical protein